MGLHFIPNPVNIRYICLDTFSKVIQNDPLDTDKKDWLTFLSCKDANSINRSLSSYPIFADIYREINRFRQDPKELIYMFSEALAIMNHNTELYMIDELKKSNERKDKALADKDKVIAQLQSQLKNQS